MSGIILINSNDENTFAAFSDGEESYSFFCEEFLSKDENKRKPADFLFSCLSRLASKYGNRINSADSVAVTTGPGSFTGIRVGISIAKGIAFVLKCGIIPVNSFDLIAAQITSASKSNSLCLLIPAKLPEYYYRVINCGEIIQGCEKLDDILKNIHKESIIAGNLSDDSLEKLSYFETVNTKNSGISVQDFYSIAKASFESGNISKPSEVEPFYLKKVSFKKLKNLQ